MVSISSSNQEYVASCGDPSPPPPILESLEQSAQ